jgi:hypothetical protein
MNEEVKHCHKLAKRIEELGGVVEWDHSDIKEHTKLEDNCVIRHVKHNL